MRKCAGIKPDGTRCERVVPDDAIHCYSHDESRKAKRSRNASIAARAKNGEISEIRDALRKLTEEVLCGDVDVKVANSAGQLLNIGIRLVEAERKQRELEEFEQRLAALEESPQRGGASWWTS